jgi:phosphoribosylanthranilate isomerase
LQKRKLLLQQKIIAQNITNLTDARYFAAWGVDYISFNTIGDSDYFINDAAIKEIKDWVEGPQCLLEANALEFEDVADGFILSNIYSSLPIVKETFFRISFDDIIKGLPDGKYISPITSEQIELLADIDYQHLHLYFDISELELSDVLRLGNFGLVVQGGEEEKVGLKSYEELDQLYELLLDNEE